MSKKCKSRSKERRLKEKRARKQANRAKYEAWRNQGVNSKSKRAQLNLKRKKKVRNSHPEGACGNIACMRCSSIYQKGGTLHHLLLIHIENKRTQHKRDPLNTKPVED